MVPQIRDVEQISFQFVSEHRLWNVLSAQLNGLTVPDTWLVKLWLLYFVHTVCTVYTIQQGCNYIVKDEGTSLGVW